MLSIRYGRGTIPDKNPAKYLSTHVKKRILDTIIVKFFFIIVPIILESISGFAIIASKGLPWLSASGSLINAPDSGLIK